MPDSQGLGPAIPRRRLGAALRELRQERKKNLGDVAKDLLISTSKLSRLEKGLSPARERDIRDLLNYYDQSGTELGQRMRRWAEEGRTEGSWHQNDAVPTITDRYLQYETAAIQIGAYVTHFVPSLLQTESYARALISALDTEDSQQVEELVKVRMSRKAVLTREDYPLSLDFIIDESTLHRVVGTSDVMRDQLENLVEASLSPTVTLRILAFDAGPDPALLEGSFTIFQFRRPIDPDVVNIEGRITDRYIEGDQVEVYQKRLEGLKEKALTPGQSRDFITRLTEGL